MTWIDKDASKIDRPTGGASSSWVQQFVATNVKQGWLFFATYAPEAVRRTRADADVVVVSNPEFLREGATISDVKHPDRAMGVYEAAQNADAVVIFTEWNRFHGLDLPRLRAALRTLVPADLRNIYNPAEITAKGLSYSDAARTIRNAQF